MIPHCFNQLAVPPSYLDLGMLSQVIPNNQDSGHSSSNSSFCDRLSPFSGNSTLLDTDQYNFSAVVRKPDIFSLISPNYRTSNSRKVSESSSNSSSLGSSYSSSFGSVLSLALNSPVFEELGPCRSHTNQIKEYFCSQCVDEVCVECIKQQHTEHYLHPGLTCKQLFEETDKAQITVRDNIKALDKQLQKLQYCKLMAASNVKSFFQRIREMVDNRESELLREVNFFTECRMRIVDEKLKENQNAINNSNTMMNQLTDFLLKGDFDSVLNNCKFAKKQLEDLRSVHRSLQQTPDEDIVFLPPDDTFLNKLRAMGAVVHNNSNGGYNNFGGNMNNSFFDNNLSSFGTYQQFGPSLLNSPITPITQLPPVPSTLATPESYNLPMLPFIGNPISNEIVPISPLAAMPTDNMGIFPVSFHTRRNYSRIKKPVTVFGKEGSGDYDLCRPWGVCCDNNGHVIVADRSNNRIQIFRSDGSHVRSFGRQGTEEGQFNRPAGVAIDYYGRIIVTDKDNHRIQVFTMEGNFVFAFGERGQTSGKFHYPWDVDVNSHGHIAVTDTRNHRVQIFSGNGVFMKKFGFESVSTMWKFFDSPRGICFTPENTLMVTDFNNHRLYEIDIENQPKLLHSENYKKCELFRPQGLAMDNEGNILVADCRNNRIQVFSRQGEVIGSFGSAGKEMGQFDRPSGIALTHDGKIVVVDFGNHRIQIF